MYYPISIAHSSPMNAEDICIQSILSFEHFFILQPLAGDSDNSHGNTLTSWRIVHPTGMHVFYLQFSFWGQSPLFLPGKWLDLWVFDTSSILKIISKANTPCLIVFRLRVIPWLNRLIFESACKKQWILSYSIKLSKHNQIPELEGCEIQILARFIVSYGG